MVAALNASREGVPHPNSWGEVFEPVLMLAVVKSWRAFCESARLVNLELDGDRLRLIPSKNTVGKEGFVPLEGLTIRGSLSVGGLDKQLLRAFSFSV
ncbi:hypothetical protein GCM10007907_20320 [Chitinimonas prasina]|uniref:Uncharacterized protein n=1 Tax=Chitinimonas prasina TaxID=1434937 RepID=A0ABQ5YHV7_9NEIS|nr:hypothetical protein [Chitinimonas prasina]GLR13242.1 hypothetical protein GCM10007907_20320 [Chitinimonas prasina]